MSRRHWCGMHWLGDAPETCAYCRQAQAAAPTCQPPPAQLGTVPEAMAQSQAVAHVDPQWMVEALDASHVECERLRAALDASRAETATERQLREQTADQADRAIALVKASRAETAAAVRRAEAAEARGRAVVVAWRESGADCGSLDEPIRDLESALGAAVDGEGS